MVAYEDLFPYRGDYDFNDLVVGYRVAANLNVDGEITAISGEGYLIARGAGYNHDWHLRIPLPASSSGSGQLNLFIPGELNNVSGYPLEMNFVGDLDLTLFPRTRQLWVDNNIYNGDADSPEGVNTLPGQILQKGHRFSFSIDLGTPVALSYLDDAPFDPYLYVRDTRYEIHLVGKGNTLPDSRNIKEGLTSFVDSNNYPFAQILPEDWQVPLENTDLGEAYPEFLNFILSDRTTNIQWYNAPDIEKVQPLYPSLWKW
jgi:LruC domain-containing protein